MGTLLLFTLLTGDIDYGLDDPFLSKFGRVFLLINRVICAILIFIASIPFAILENIFILPAWGIYNLCHKKEIRRNYCQFLGLRRKK